jgi:cytoskeletal protein CcmA (bactofilin family)
MFGRRNPDPASPVMSPTAPEDDLDLDLLPDIPDILVPEQHEPAPPVPPGDPAWFASAPPTPRSSQQPSAVTQRLPALAESSAPALPLKNTTSAISSALLSQVQAIAESVIGPDDFFDGRYRSERGVRIQGNARGSIESRQYIFVETGAAVEADLSAEDITVSGSFTGKIECRRRLEVTSTGQIHGQVQTALLVVQEGGKLDGELHMAAANAAPAAPADVG